MKTSLRSLFTERLDKIAKKDGSGDGGWREGVGRVHVWAMEVTWNGIQGWFQSFMANTYLFDFMNICCRYDMKGIVGIQRTGNEWQREQYTVVGARWGCGWWMYYVTSCTNSKFTVKKLR